MPRSFSGATPTRLAETERVLACVLRSTTNGVALSDPETAVMHEVNDAFCRFAGRSREELIGKVATDYTEIRGTRDRKRLVDEVLRNGVVEGTEFLMRRPDGSVAHGRSTSYYIALGGERLVLAIIEDVTPS
ncbi:MAG TPA: PAS domain-containing protein [Solirubrobacteraceae bacterium]|nr:PAS domain-containing protein [Solirubrobacteraceae bacterium]